MNTFLIARTLGGHVVAIFAEHGEHGLYEMRIMVDGELWGYRQSDNVMKDAVDIFAEAFTAFANHSDTHKHPPSRSARTTDEAHFSSGVP